MSVNATSPADIFGGTWEALDQGRVLIGAGASHPAGETGGEETHTLSVDEMPSHDHSCESDGSHSHDGSAVSVNGHSHTRGSMNITGSFYLYKCQPDDAGASGAFSKVSTGSYSWHGTNSQTHPYSTFNFNAKNGWEGSTSSAGSHSHSLSIDSNGDHTHSIGTKGSGAAHNNMPPFLSVYMWRRIA